MPQACSEPLHAHVVRIAAWDRVAHSSPVRACFGVGEHAERDKGQHGHLAFSFQVLIFLIHLFSGHLTDIKSTGRRTVHFKITRAKTQLSLHCIGTKS
jgi:hypothetical protein